jgi:hypothetical protein
MSKHTEIIQLAAEMAVEIDELKAENNRLTRLILQEKQNVQTLKTVINGMKKIQAFELDLLKEQQDDE